MLYGQLRELKTEIEHIQHLLEKAKVKLQKDFEQWWNQQSSNTKDPSSSRNAWYTPPTSGSPSRLQPHPPLRPPSSSSSSTSLSLHSSRNHSRTRHRSSRASHRTMAAQFTQPGQQSSDKPTTDSLTVTASLLTSSLNGIGSDESKGWLSSAGRSDDVSASSGVGSSLSSSNYLHQSSRGAMLDHSSSSTTRDSTSGSRLVLVRQQPDSLPRVGRISAAADGKSLSNYPSSTHAIITNAVSHPKPLFDVGMSSLDRSQLSIPLTGDSRADADIITFYRARQKLIQKEQSPR